MLKLASIVSAVALTASLSSAAVLAEWTFEVNTPADLLNSAVGPSVAADAGSGTAVGVHASSATDWTTPSGNGSANSFSSNEWAMGDYYQFTTSTLGFKDIAFRIDHTSSGTGPRDFRVAWSIDGLTFTNVGTYSVFANAAPNNWSTGGPAVAASSFSFDLSAVTALDDKPVVFLRTIMNTSTSANFGTVAAGGTSRVDNVIVRGVVIPEPATLGLLAGAGLLALRRRA
jgi:hypothetical protein